jgi:hypothetical protein
MASRLWYGSKEFKFAKTTSTSERRKIGFKLLRLNSVQVRLEDGLAKHLMSTLDDLSTEKGKLDALVEREHIA